MLRRKPTALTISNEDFQIFEDKLARRIAYAQFKKTGEDPEGLFTGANTQQRQAENQQPYGTPGRGVSGTVDPNDELKPLPGDKARIVRNREERITGTRGPTQ